MAIKKSEPYGPALKIDDVFRAGELERLAEDWARQPHLFETVQLARYRELCDYYEVDPMILLYTVQNRIMRPNSTEQTGVFPQVGELEPAAKTG